MPSISDSSSRRPLVVLGDDGAQPADIAWQWMSRQRWPRWHVDVMTADANEARIEWGKPPRFEPWEPTWSRPASDIDGAESLRFLKVNTDPRAMLADVAADLLVVGLRSGSYLDAVVTGSTTEWLLHHPPAPLLVARTAQAVSRVVVCSDGSDHAMSAIASFTALPLAAAAEVTVLAVDDGRAEVEAAIADASAALEGRVRSASTVKAAGQPARVILDVIGEVSPHLVVLGTRGLTGWRRLRLGSTAAAVVRMAPCNGLVDFAPSDPKMD